MISPALSFRGFHYDLARRNHDSLSSLRALVRCAAGCGLNALVLYMEDLWKYRRHPQLASPHAYRLPDMGELARYARARGVDLIPSLTTMGHSRHILEKPKYRHLAWPGTHTFDVRLPAVYRLFEDLFDEVLPHFDSPFVFINGDEANLSRLPRGAARVAGLKGLGALYGHAMGRFARSILRRGRRPIVWHDMFLHHPEALDQLPRETVIAFWYYDYMSGAPAIAHFASRGFDVLAAPGLLENAGAPDHARALPSLRRQIQEAVRQGTPRPGRPRYCLGVLTTVWEQVPWRDSMLEAFATGRWSCDPELPVSRVLRDYAREILGATSPSAGRAIRDFSLHSGRRTLALQARAASRSSRERRLLKSRADLHARRLRAALRDLRLAPHHGSPMGRDARAGLRAMFRRTPVLGPPALVPAFGSRTSRIAEPYLDQLRSGMQVIDTKTRHGHRLVILGNGRLAVSLLPEFGAVMPEWLVLGEQPWSPVLTNYDAWASASPRVPGDPGLGSPWGATALGGWRETIYFQARLNPSTLWGRPFRFEVLRHTSSRLVVECVGRNEVAIVRRRLTLERGRAMIRIESHATARRDHSWLAIQPNAGHRLPGTSSPLLQRIEWPARTYLVEHDGTKTFAPRGSRIRIVSPISPHFLELRFRPTEIDRLLTDAGTQWFTLEPLGRPRPCRRGQAVSLHLEYRLAP